MGTMTVRVSTSTGYTAPAQGNALQDPAANIGSKPQTTPANQGPGVQPPNAPPPPPAALTMTDGSASVGSAVAAYQNQTPSAVATYLMFVPPAMLAYATPAEQQAFADVFQQAGQALTAANERLAKAEQAGAPEATLAQLRHQQASAQTSFDRLQNDYLPVLLARYQQEAAPRADAPAPPAATAQPDITADMQALARVAQDDAARREPMQLPPLQIER